MIKLNNLSLDFAGNTIFRNISLQVNKSDRIGLIGNNGSGKTTLLNLLSKNIIPTDGSISGNQNINIAHLPQELSFNSNTNLKDFVVGLNSEIKELDNQINLINDSLSKVNVEKKQFELIDQLEKIQFKKDNINILDVEIRSEKIMKGLGFKDSDFIKNIKNFSGGWKMRAELARLLVLEPEMLLLDEPTNHLDLPAIIWLEKFLHSTKCTIILVSHDVEFLNKNTSRIFDISQKSIKDFSGNYSKYIIFREKEIERQIKEKKNQNKYIKQTNLLIEKFRYKKNKASFAQTLIKRLNKMEEIEIDEFDVSSIRFQFPEPLHCGKIIFQAKLLKKAFGENVVFEDFDLDIYRGDRIAFVGKNGCGKTTLTRIINGDLDCEGYYKIGEKVIINYFAQNQNERLDSNMSIIEYVESIAQDKSVSQLRGILGSFLFSGDSVYKKIKVLSGGEKARLSLCASLLTPSNVIILDEPTNHLDIFAKDILKEALLQYNGTLIVVSHDRKFLTGLTDRVIEFSDNKIREYPGDINSYLDNQEIKLDEPIKKKRNNNNFYQQKKEIAKHLRSLKKQSTVIETEITKIENEIETFNQLLSNVNNNNLDKPINYNDYNKLNEMLNTKLDKWEEIQAKINQLDKIQ